MTLAVAATPSQATFEHLPLIETPETFASVFDFLKAEKIDHILTRIAYEVDWEEKGKVTINVIANVSSMHATIIGYLPVAGVTKGAFKLSLGMLRASLAIASLGACRMLGLPEMFSFHDITSHIGSVRDGIIEIMPLAFGTGAFISNYTPSVDLLVTDLKVSQDKLGVISEFCHSTVASAVKTEESKYDHYKPWARTLAVAGEKTFVFASDGVECLVTCAAWGDLAIGTAAIVTAPVTGGASIGFGLTSITRGALALGASTLLDLAKEYDLQGKVMSYFVEDKKPDDGCDAVIYRLCYNLYNNAANFNQAYEAIENED